MSEGKFGSGNTRPLVLVWIVLLGTAGGAAVGALVNAVNGVVSEEFFVGVFGWEGFTDVWRASVALGIFQGLMFGVVLALIFAAVVGFVTKATCPFGEAFKYMVAILLCALGCYVVGGLIALGLAALSPEFFINNFTGVPHQTARMLGYAWVGGSNQGVVLGGLGAVVIGALIFRGNWRRAEQDRPGAGGA